MTTSQKRTARPAAAKAGRPQASAAAKASTEPKKAPEEAAAEGKAAAKVKADKAPKEPSVPTYREHADFVPRLKEAKAAAKGNADLTQALGLITHFGWKTPGGSVGWAKGTTAGVIAAADDLLVPSGTPIPDAMNTVLSAAAKAATDDAQKSTVAALAEIVKQHNA